MIHRDLQQKVAECLEQFPAVAILGPRQVGKTTLARLVSQSFKPDPIYLDLERPEDMSKLADPVSYLENYKDRLVIIDEVQRLPGLFQVLRGIIDERRRLGFRTRQFLLLGSASKMLLQQSSESLAGRIAYTDLNGLNVQEVGVEHRDALWIRGGFPDSFLATSDLGSLTWRQNFIRTYLEREIPQMGSNVAAETLRRFWIMLAHHQGGLLNQAHLASGLGVSATTINRYLDLMVDLFLVRLLRPWSSNVGKRLVKTPKVYIRDSGLTHALLNLTTLDDVLSHPVVGTSWENFVIENILSVLDFTTTAWFYRTAAGAEADLVLEQAGGQRIVIEIKRSMTPSVSKGMHNACQDLEAAKAYIVYPGTERYSLSPAVEAISLQDLMTELS